eukprot:8240664-Alexandrium_andersonii.AAC.1
MQRLCTIFPIAHPLRVRMSRWAARRSIQHFGCCGAAGALSTGPWGPLGAVRRCSRSWRRAPARRTGITAAAEAAGSP